MKGKYVFIKLPFREVIHMHIGINAQLLSLTQNYRNGGISRYIRYLLSAIVRQPGQHKYTFFVNGSEIVNHISQITGKDLSGRSADAQITCISESWP